MQTVPIQIAFIFIVSNCGIKLVGYEATFPKGTFSALIYHPLTLILLVITIMTFKIIT